RLHAELFGETGHCWRVVEVAHRERGGVGVTAQRRDHLRRGDRGATERKEVVVHRDPVHTREAGAERLGDAHLDAIAWRDHLTITLQPDLDVGERLAIKLARHIHGERTERREVRRHHRRWELATEFLLEPLTVERPSLLKDDEGDELLLGPGPLHLAGSH